MNIAKSFAEFLVDNGYGTLGVDLFIGGVPQDAGNKAMWILAGGGAASTKNTTNEKLKQYIISVYYRNTDMQDVYETLQRLEELINSDACTQLDGYDTIDLEATGFPTDNDLDADDRTIGLLQVTLTTYL